MQMFQLLQALDGDIAPERCKLHLAVRDGTENPVDVYLEGKFDEWQVWQTKRNFERPFVVSLIALSRGDTWLFAGVHESTGCRKVPERGLYRYRLRRRASVDELDGRLVVRFRRPGRQSYLCAERWYHSLEVAELRPVKLKVADFPGYSWARLGKRHLDLVVGEAIESWRSALVNVSGVYVIADRCAGRLYVGSASGGEGIWKRWCEYSRTGHGGNRELKELLRREGADYAKHFQYGVLEIADTHASEADILHREAYWKKLLLSQIPHGLNAN